MNIIKWIFTLLGLLFAGMLVLWLFGWAAWILSWLFWPAVIGLLAYGGYKLFTKAEAKALGSDPHSGLGTGDIQMSWDEYDRKYLRK